MSLPETVQPKKSKKTLWIVLAIVAAVLLCCIVAAVLGGLFYYSAKKKGTLPLTANAPTPTSTTNPQVPAGEALTIEPANPTSSSYPAIVDLATDWQTFTQPGMHNWPIIVSENQPVFIFLGWCASSQEILDFNVKHITYQLSIDDLPIDITRLYKYDWQDSEQFCQSYGGIIRRWPGTYHTIVTTMNLDWALNDGWDDYMAGDYTDVFNITVTP